MKVTSERRGEIRKKFDEAVELLFKSFSEKDVKRVMIFVEDSKMEISNKVYTRKNER